MLTSVLLALVLAAAAPNVVVIETDDQRADDLVAMPRTRALIGGQGVEFANSFVSLSECCASRATFLTGQYAHNHGVRACRRSAATSRSTARRRSRCGCDARATRRAWSASTSTAIAAPSSHPAGPTSRACSAASPTASTTTR